MVIAFFSIDNKANGSRFFEKTSLLADISINIALRMSFLILSNIEINILKWKFNQKSYITFETLMTTKHIELVGEKKFAAVAFDLDDKTFMVNIASLTSTDVHPFYRAQIASLI